MAYKFVIESQAELESLQWIAERYDYATAIERAITKAPTDPTEWSIDSEAYPVTFNISESNAWEIQSAVEAEDGFLTCMGGRLKDEVIALLGKIV